MINDFEILSTVYDRISVVGVTSVISGAIYNGDKPTSSRLQDITTNCVSNISSNRGQLQTGVLNINCWCKQRDNGVQDNAKLIEISNSVFSALGMVDDEVQINGLTLKKDNLKTFRDNVQNDMFYTNIRLLFTLKN